MSYTDAPVDHPDLFICHTPFHVLQALATLTELPHTASVVVVVGDFPGARRVAGLVDSLGIWEGRFCPGLVERSGDRGRRPGSGGPRAVSGPVRVKANLRRLERVVPEEFDDLYVFNTRRAEDQWLLARSAREAPTAHRVLMSDGISDMHEPEDRLLRNRGPIYRLLGSIWYGPWWQEIVRFREHPLITERRPLFAPAAPGKAGGWERRFARALNGEAMRRFCSDAVKRPLPDDQFGLLLLPPWRLLEQYPEYRHRFIDMVRPFLAADPTLYAKPHVTDLKPHAWAMRLGVAEDRVSDTDAAEYLYVAARDRISRVVADISTALLTARLLLGETAVVMSIARAIGSADTHSAVVHAYQERGIELPAADAIPGAGRER
jgi:hypothetical protein